MLSRENLSDIWAIFAKWLFHVSAYSVHAPPTEGDILEDLCMKRCLDLKWILTRKELKPTPLEI